MLIYTGTFYCAAKQCSVFSCGRRRLSRNISISLRHLCREKFTCVLCVCMCVYVCVCMKLHTSEQSEPVMSYALWVCVSALCLQLCVRDVSRKMRRCLFDAGAPSLPDPLRDGGARGEWRRVCKVRRQQRNGNGNRNLRGRFGRRAHLYPQARGHVAGETGEKPNLAAMRSFRTWKKNLASIRAIGEEF